MILNREISIRQMGLNNGVTSLASALLMEKSGRQGNVKVGRNYVLSSLLIIIFFDGRSF